jgi:hypothetical protein
MAGKYGRPKLNSKEELIAYLEANKDLEYPFNEEAWNIAVEKTKDKETKYKEMITTEFDGKKKVKKIPNGAISPVGKYFQLMSLPQYRKGKTLDEEPIFVEDDYNDELPAMDDQDDENENEDDVTDEEEKEKQTQVTSWIDIFFAGYSPLDKRFIRERLGNYYDNYEINDGADKLLVTKAVADELEIMNLTKQRAKNKDVEKRLETVQKGYLSLLDSLKALKKQRGAMDGEGKNKFTIWLDTLEKSGEFKPKKIEYENDAIDNMIVTLERSIVEVMRNG